MEETRVKVRLPIPDRRQRDKNYNVSVEGFRMVA